MNLYLKDHGLKRGKNKSNFPATFKQKQGRESS